LPAFDRGLALGADGLELDVHLSRDGVPVVHHDGLLDRTTDASGPIRDRTVSELAAINACAGFARSGRAWDGGSAGVPTLGEVLRRYPDIRLIVELKGPSAALARAVVDTVREAGAIERTCIELYGLLSRAWRQAHRRQKSGSPFTHRDLEFPFVPEATPRSRFPNGPVRLESCPHALFESPTRRILRSRCGRSMIPLIFGVFSNGAPMPSLRTVPIWPSPRFANGWS
jgi:hypothetical protein